MHENLWAGVSIKQRNAGFHLIQMGNALQRPRWGAHLQSNNTIIGTNWQETLYAHFDAFLSAIRSVPWVIEACFGADNHRNLKDWLNHLTTDERKRRHRFSRELGTAKAHKAFLKLRLVKARNTSVHHTGYAPVVVKISGLWGVTYLGGPANRVPDAETRLPQPGDVVPADWPVGNQSVAPVLPRSSDFTIGGRPLFDECQASLDATAKVIEEARTIAATVHGSAKLTMPRGA